MNIPDMLLRSVFYIELIFYVIPFALPLAGRRFFPLRAAGACILWTGFTFIWPFKWSSVFGLSILNDLLIFVLFCALIFFCFNCPLKMALYCATGAYAFQQIGLQLNMTVNGGLIPLEKIQLVNILCYLAVAAVLFVCAYLIFTRLLRKNKDKYIKTLSIFIISMFLVSALAVFNAANNIWLNRTAIQITYVFRLFIVCCCLLTLWQEYSFYQLDRAREEINVINELRHREQKQMEQLHETADLINIKAHDMRHLLSLIQIKSDSSVENEISHINNLVDIYNFNIDTGNETLNLVLAEKGLLCSRDNIRLNCIADGKSLLFMDDVDIFSLFGNALDNAIRAVRNIEDIEFRVINLNISGKAQMVSVRIENYYSGNLIFKDGLVVTDQENTGVHGYGMRSMRLIAEKYHGSMEIEAENGIFVLSMILAG